MSKRTCKKRKENVNDIRIHGRVSKYYDSFSELKNEEIKEYLLRRQFLSYFLPQMDKKKTKNKKTNNKLTVP